MPLASSSYSYPLLGAFWTIFLIFLWVIWFWVLIWVFIDIFRSRDLSGWAKALWFLFVLFIPLIGVLVYLIARGGSMQDRAAQAGPAAGPGVPRLRPGGRGEFPGQPGGPAGPAGRPPRPRGYLRRGVRPREGQAPGGLTRLAQLCQCGRLPAAGKPNPSARPPWARSSPAGASRPGLCPRGGDDVEQAGYLKQAAVCR